MADLDSLIRVRKHTIEQKQKVLAELYRQAQEMKDRRDALETELAIETEKTKDMTPDLLKFFGPYADNTLKRIEGIDQQRAMHENKIVLAQDVMRDAFAELKKIEIIDDRRKAEDLAAFEKKISNELDEIAIDGFRRQNET